MYYSSLHGIVYIDIFSYILDEYWYKINKKINTITHNYVKKNLLQWSI